MESQLVCIGWLILALGLFIRDELKKIRQLLEKDKGASLEEEEKG